MKTTINTSREFIQFGSQSFRELGQGCPMWDFLAQHGVEMFAHPKLPGKYHEWKGPMKQCFHNAANAAFHEPELIYCEGYASSIIPTLHAWCLDPEGRVLELTWSKPATDYFGIPFKLKFLVQQAIANEEYGLIDQMKNHFALVRGQFPKKDWWERKALTRLSSSVKLNKNPGR